MINRTTLGLRVTIAVALVATAALGSACAGSARPCAPAERPRPPGTAPDDTVIYTDILSADHRLEFVEATAGVRGIVEVAKQGTAPVVTRDMQGKSFAQVFALTHPNGAVLPAALRTSDERAAAAAAKGHLRQVPPPENASIHTESAAEQQWFHDNFCDSQHVCVHQRGPTMITTPQQVASYETVGMAPSEATTDSSFAEYWSDCRSGTCFWSRIDRVSLPPGWYAKMSAGFEHCPDSAVFASTIAGDPQAEYDLSMTYWLWIDC